MRCDQWRTHRRSRAERQKWPFIPGDETSLRSEEAFRMPLRVEMSAQVACVFKTPSGKEVRSESIANWSRRAATRPTNQARRCFVSKISPHTSQANPLRD